MNDRKETPLHDPHDLAWLEAMCEQVGRNPERLIPLLQAIQERYRYLPQPLLEHLPAITSVSPAAIAGVATFYDKFRFRPAGLHTIKVCTGTACHVKGSSLIYDALYRTLGCRGDEDTGADGVFTLQRVACLGCCTLAPVVQIDSTTYGHVTAASAPGILDDFLRRDKSPSDRQYDSPPGGSLQTIGEVRVGSGSCCIAGGSVAVADAARRSLRQMGNPATVKLVGCVGMCHRTPLLEVTLNNGSAYTYEHVDKNDVSRILRRHFRPRGIARRLKGSIDELVETALTGSTRQTMLDSHDLRTHAEPVRRFLDRQRYLATELRGSINPVDIDEYCRNGGFTALVKCLVRQSPEQVIETIAASGLRGRGGAGFPTAEKWRRVRENRSGKVYIVCNGDEGDPGAFMDRMLFESYPYRIIEGMTIAAYAVGATEGILYIRAEYPLAVERVTEALEQCRLRNFTGDTIAGTSFSLNLRVMEGAGAFVCGEETALLQSIEGKRGMPRYRPPYPAQKGLFDAPTLINNCETFACVPWIVRNGAAAFAAIGTAAGCGTKVFSLAGKVRYGGLIEVPLGISLRDVVEQIGGGCVDGRKFKAVQIGGPSGGCIPASECDIPVDYEALRAAGGMMGSGGLVVLDDSDCMVDIARYFLQFTQQQSCGRCTFCRAGTRRLLDILEKLCDGRGTVPDLDQLESLANTVVTASVCGLGKTAPNPVLTTLRYFRDEYIAHCKGECPAGKCKPLISYMVTDKCIGCTRCSQHCPAEAIPFTPYFQHRIDDERCVRCDTCRTGCPMQAIAVVARKSRTPARSVSGVPRCQR